MMHVVVTLKGRTVGRYDVEGDLVRIGRHPDNEVQIDNMSVSRFHCRLEREDGRWGVVDEGSHNGTFLNGARIETVDGSTPEPRSGDVLGVGQFHVTVQIGSESGRMRVPVIAVHVSSDPETREAAAPEKGFLLRENSPGPTVLLARDVTQLGSSPDAHVEVPGPSKQALIVRGYGGLQVVNTAPPHGVAVNGHAVTDARWLSEKDLLQVGGLQFRVFRGAPNEGRDESTMTLQRPGT